MDLEIKAGDKEQVRRIFKRVTSGKLKPKKAKFFFKRWVDFEERDGDEKRVEGVTARAAEYVKRLEEREEGKE